ncbi:MAG: hypothetical protein ACREPK_02365 [Rhodanobacteraceae bacterium]
MNPFARVLRCRCEPWKSDAIPYGGCPAAATPGTSAGSVRIGGLVTAGAYPSATAGLFAARNKD